MGTAERCCRAGLSTFIPELPAGMRAKNAPGYDPGARIVTLTPEDQAGWADRTPGRLPAPDQWACPYRQGRPPVSTAPGTGAPPPPQAQSAEHRQVQPVLGRLPERERQQEPEHPPEPERQREPGHRREPGPGSHWRTGHFGERRTRRRARRRAAAPPHRRPPRRRRLPARRLRPRRPACTRSRLSSTERLPHPDSTLSRRRISPTPATTLILNRSKAAIDVNSLIHTRAFPAQQRCSQKRAAIADSRFDQDHF